MLTFAATVDSVASHFVNINCSLLFPCHYSVMDMVHVNAISVSVMMDTVERCVFASIQR